MTTFLGQLGVTLPLIQAPMAGVSTPEMAAAVSNAGGLGSIAVGASNAAQARGMIAEVRARTDKPFNVNLFTHARPTGDAVRDARWLEWLAPIFASFDAQPPPILRTIYKSFVEDADMLSVLLDMAPPVVSFHFGLPSPAIITALKARGIILLATATNREEGRAIEAAGVDAIVAQGIEAGGHRGMFDPAAPDDALSSSVLTRLLVRHVGIPVVAAGGIMDGAGIQAMLNIGAVAAQLGTAFIACPESGADDAYRAALMGPGAYHTRLTSLISGRPARSLANDFTALEDMVASRPQVPDYPIAYDAGKALHAAATAQGHYGYGAQWAGQGAPLIRPMPVAELLEILRAEME